VAGKPSRFGRPIVTVRILRQAVLNFEPARAEVFAAGGPGAPLKLARTAEGSNQQCKREHNGILPGLLFLAEQTGTLASMPTGTLLYSYNSHTSTIREKQINLFGAATTYRLLCEAPGEQSEAAEKYFDSVAANFKPFVGPGRSA
jgi:hypothetical protein